MRRGGRLRLCEGPGRRCRQWTAGRQFLLGDRRGFGRGVKAGRVGFRSASDIFRLLRRRGRDRRGHGRVGLGRCGRRRRLTRCCGDHGSSQGPRRRNRTAERKLVLVCSWGIEERGMFRFAPGRLRESECSQERNQQAFRHERTPLNRVWQGTDERGVGIRHAAPGNRRRAVPEPSAVVDVHRDFETETKIEISGGLPNHGRSSLVVGGYRVPPFRAAPG
jgi:hypothetical protein